MQFVVQSSINKAMTKGLTMSNTVLISTVFTCHSSSLRTVEENCGFSQQQKRNSLMVSSELLQSSMIFFT